MDKNKRKRLEATGWVFGEARDFLGLDAGEAAIVDLKLALADAIKAERNRRRITQDRLARMLGSSQSRVAKMESADASVSIDLMVRSLLRMGASRKQVAACIAAAPRKHAA